MKLRITHLRVPMGANPKRIVPGLTPLATAGQWLAQGAICAARGGLTLATLESENGSQIQAMAHCSPKDNYNRKTGRELALKRLGDAVLEAMADIDDILFP